MRRDPRMYLYDIAAAVDAIMTFMAGLTRDGYIEDDLIRSAVERKFEIIGEAINQLAKISPQVASRISEAREAIAFRNVLAHGYFLVDHDVVWKTAVNSLPGLRANVAALIEELSARKL